MKKLTLRPVLLALLLMLSAVAVRQAVAATISDLGDSYSGATHSHVDPDFEFINAEFTVDTINRSSFTGVFSDGSLDFAVKGTVSRTGRVSFSGKYEEPLDDTKLTIRGTGQLSASGGFFLGTATEQGKLDGDRFKDSLSFALQNDDFIIEAAGAAKAGKK